MDAFERVRSIKKGVGLNVDSNSVFKYTCSKYLKNYLIDNTIRFNSAFDFNDPFEGLYRYQHWLRSADERLECMLPDDKFEEEGLVRRVREEVGNRIGNFSMSCFSNIPDEPLMWAHYADEHKGICLCFDRMNLFRSGEGILHREVRYANQLPILDFFKGVSTLSMLGSQIDEIVFSKSISWEYEKEYRYCVDRKLEAVEFNPKALKYVIVGCRFEKEDELKGFLLEFNEKHKAKVEIFYARPSIDEYKVVFYDETMKKNYSKYSLPIYDPNDKPIT